MTLGEKIREVREQKGVSQNDLSKSIFVSPEEIGRWESNKDIPSKRRLEDLEKYFNLEKDFFISQEEYEVLDKVFEKKRKIRKILKYSKYPLILVAFIIFLQICFLPKQGKFYDIDGKTYVVYKNKGLFGDGEVELIAKTASTDINSSVANIPDTISVWEGIYFLKFKVKYVYIGELYEKNEIINLPRYFEGFCYTYPVNQWSNAGSNYGEVEFNKISVSPLNKKYDSRDDCGCLIDSKTDTILYGSNVSVFVPEGVKEVNSHCLRNFFRTEKTRYTLPSSVETLGDFAFSSFDTIEPNARELYRYNGTNRVDYFDFGSVKKIGRGILSKAFLPDSTIILPKTLRTIYEDSLNSYKGNIEIVNIFYKGTKEDWEKVEIVNSDNHELYINCLESNFYYYSEEKPSENGVYWHYDENNNPVVWE